MGLGIKSLIENCNPDLSNSYVDYHVSGVNYVCLHRTDSLTIKLYDITSGHDLTFYDWLVGPHNHAYNFHQKVLHGSIQHGIFHESSSGINVNKYVYKSPLNGGNGFSYDRPTKLRCSTKKLNKGDEYFLNTSQIHTICPTSNRVILFSMQYEDILKETMFFGLERPDSTNIYQKMDMETAQEILDFTISCI